MFVDLGFATVEFRIPTMRIGTAHLPQEGAHHNLEEYSSILHQLAQHGLQRGRRTVQIYDSVDHAWLLQAMIRRGAPRAEALWYIRETQKSTLNPMHGPWSAGEICPQRGLKQGCSCSPMLFRRCVQDVLLPLSQSWRSRGMGIPAEDGRLITHRIWADDTWLFAQTPEHLAAMIAELQEAN